MKQIPKRFLGFARKSHRHTALVSACFVIFVATSVILIQQVRADAGWTQTTWNGGVGTSTTNQYSAASNVDTATSGQASLSQSSQYLSNTDFENDLNSWNSGVMPSAISGLKAWYKADALTGLNDGDAVPTWNDSSTSGWSLSQSTPASRPTYKTNIVNGQPVVRFDGTNDYINTSSVSGFTNAASIFIMQVIRGAQCGGSYELGVNNGVNTGISNLPWCGTTMYSRFTTPSAPDTTWAYTTPYTHQMTQVYNGGSTPRTAKTWENGTLKASQTAANATFSATPNTLIMGALATNAYYLQTDIGEYILYNSAVTDADRAQIESYIQNKYGLSSANQTITRDSNTYHGGAASAKVVASGQNTNYWQSVTTPDAGTYAVSAYVYTNGSAVTSADAQLYARNSALSTTYTAAGGGWYKLTATVAGSTTASDYGVQVKSGKTAYVDDTSLVKIQTSGTLTSAIFDGGVQNNWNTLTYNRTVPTGTSISVKVRTGDQANLSDASAFSSCSAITSGADATSACAPDKTRYAQYQVTFTSDGSDNPTFNDVTLGYSASDTVPPDTNASSILMYKSNGGASVASNGWNNTNPYFSWTAGVDDGGGSGIKGYCLYLGQDNTANPATTKGILGSSPLNTNGACQFAVSGTNIDLSTSGYIGSALASSNSPYYLIVKAIDNADNVYSGSGAAFHFRYDNTPPSNPSFVTAPSQFVSSKDVALTWPTAGSDSASDANSGLAGLQYRIGSSGIWYGDTHNSNEDATDLLTNDGSYTTQSSPDFASLVEGNNIVYFRTWDAAGNTSPAYITTVIKLNTSSPSSPQNVTATPSTNTTNSFGFSWLAPATYTGSVGNITYCYSVNTLPSSGNCTYTAAGVTSLPAGAYATQPGENTFYVVAKDEAGNINYATVASTTFTANTAAPGVPLNVDAADISVKTTSNWKLALSWEEPTQTGAGVASYKVMRSANGTSFSQVASTSGTSYVDGSLSQQTYYYKVKACDSANNCGALTNAVSKFPTGKFTTPANLLSGPAASDTSTKKATISWVTDRESDTRVEYGTEPGKYQATEASKSDQTVNHAIDLTNLSPGTTYYYRTKWTDEDGNQGASAEKTFVTEAAPSVQDVDVTSVNLTSATIRFTSSKATSVKIYYGQNTGFGGTKTINTSLTTSTYDFKLEGLNDGTKYYFKLNTFDADGNEYDNRTVLNFTTPSRPRITNLRFQPVPDQPTSTQQVTWNTNVPSTSELAYGPNGQAQQNAADPRLTTDHSVTINALNDNTEYSLIAQSRDSAGNLATSDKQIFHTALDTRPPKISGLKVTSSIKGTGTDAAGQIIVSWKTDEPATSQVAYGEGSDNSNFNTSTAEDRALVTDHAVVVSNLSTSQIFHLQALSKDVAGNQAHSDSRTTIVGNATDSVISIIFSALQKVFGGF